MIRGLAKVASDVEDESLPYMRLDSRIARKHYGTQYWEDFDLSKNHDPSRKFVFLDARNDIVADFQ